MKKRMAKILAMFCAAIMIISSVVVFGRKDKVNAAQKFKIHFIDVGCGDGALLQYGEGSDAKYALIDAGAATYHETTDTKYKEKEAPVYNYLKKLGVNHLEFVILTHPHSDHIGGMVKILEDPSIKIDTIYGNNLQFEYLKSSNDVDKQNAETARWTAYDTKQYQQFKDALKKRNDEEDASLHISYLMPKAGSKISLGKAQITFYGPLKNDYKYGKKVDLNIRQVNKYSIVTKVVYGQNSFLMAGDAQKETVEKLIKSGYDLTAQVLKQPHHGFQDLREEDKKKNKDSSNHKLLIDKSKASIVVISNGYKNTDKVPFDSVLNDLSQKDVYETGNRGTIIISSDGQQLSICTEKGNNQPSVAGKVIASGQDFSIPVLKSIYVYANIKEKLVPQLTGSKNTYDIYEKKNITIRFGADASSFATLNKVEYKFVKRGQKSDSVEYKKGNRISLKDGSAGVVYIRYQTTFGAKTIKLPGIIVDMRAPTKAKIIKQRSKGNITYRFQADYGISGKRKTQYKIVPRGKKESRYHWKDATSFRYLKKYRKSTLYVRFIDKAGNITLKKSVI